MPHLSMYGSILAEWGKWAEVGMGGEGTARAGRGDINAYVGMIHRFI